MDKKENIKREAKTIRVVYENTAIDGHGEGMTFIVHDPKPTPRNRDTYGLIFLLLFSRFLFMVITSL